jgi:hypothetical protein
MAGVPASHRANHGIARSGKTMKALLVESFGNLLRGSPGWYGFSINVFHDKVRHLEFGGVNLRNAWRTVVTNCLFVDILLSLVLRVQRDTGIIFDEVRLEEYAASEDGLKFVFLVFSKLDDCLLLSNG